VARGWREAGTELRLADDKNADWQAVFFGGSGRGDRIRR